jgi:glycosyltransferase involved in cell wall biosynthesis
VSPELARVGRYARGGVRWVRLLTRVRRGQPGVRIFYGFDEVPASGEPVAGGSAKIQRLAARFPNSQADFTLLYLASNWVPRDLRPLLWVARRRKIPLILNQDGVGYPGWAGEETEHVNRRIRRLLSSADHVLYQSEFCKRSADLWVGPPSGSWEVLHNAVDVEHFTPAGQSPASGPVLLLGGDQTQAYRLELALATLAALLPSYPDARMIVTGRLVVSGEPLIADLGLQGRVDLVGRYSQADAPALFRRAHVLLHTKVNDPCPSVVLEAMATGLPVVYADSGGVPELVGPDAGIGVSHPEGYERDEPPDPEALADAASRVLADLPTYGSAARSRVVEQFRLEPWLDRHAELFEQLVLR